MKRKLFAVILMASMLVCTIGSTAFAADPLKPTFVQGSKDGKLTFDIAVDQELEEFEVSATISADVANPEDVLAIAIDGDFQSFANKNNGMLASGIPYEPKNTVVFGGVFSKAVQYAGKIATITVDEAALSDGDTVSIYGDGVLVYTYTHQTIVYGDVDGKAGITADDALKVLRAVVKLDSLSEQLTKAADVNGQAGVTADDALLILQKVVKLISRFPVEASVSQ